MLGPLDLLLWLLELSAEALAAALAFRHFRRLRAFWLYLLFIALADALALALYFTAAPADRWAAWLFTNYAARLAGYICLAVLAVLYMGECAHADPRALRTYGLLAALLAAGLIVMAHGAAPWHLLAALSIVFRIDLGLVAVVTGAMFLRQLEVIITPLRRPWPMIAAGLLTAVVSEALANKLWQHGLLRGPVASRLAALGHLAALAVWILGVWKPLATPQIVRAPLGVVALPELPLVQDDRVEMWN